MFPTRRSVLSALGLLIPAGLLGRERTSVPPALAFRSFEEGVRQALASRNGNSRCFRVEVGFCEAMRAGIQGCHNDRPFGGIAAGGLRIVRVGSAPGPVIGNVRLYVSYVDLIETLPGEISGTPLDFATLPPAPFLCIQAHGETADFGMPGLVHKTPRASQPHGIS